MSVLPSDAAARKNIPLCSGLLDYFPAALVEVAKLSKRGNDQHNPGEPLHHARGKSNDHLDALMRHLVDRELVEVAWRALAALQEQCEANGAPLARGARLPESAPARPWVPKGGDRVRGDRGYTFDPSRGIVIGYRGDGVWDVDVEGHPVEGGYPGWGYLSSHLSPLTDAE